MLALFFSNTLSSGKVLVGYMITGYKVIYRMPLIILYTCCYLIDLPFLPDNYKTAKTNLNDELFIHPFFKRGCSTVADVNILIR